MNGSVDISGKSPLKALLATAHALLCDIDVLHL